MTRHPGVPVEVWAEDEARFGLIPTVRRVWSPVGVRPLARGCRRYQWSYLYGFVEPSTGRLFTLILPSVSTVLMNLALKSFADYVGAGPDRHILLVIDGAGWHSTRRLQLPEGLHLVFLPPYSPELQPAERLWPLINEVLANRAFTDLRSLEDTVERRCRQLAAQTETIKALAHYHWWPTGTAAPSS